jgi:zinc transport system ATP-binding protein
MHHKDTSTREGIAPAQAEESAGDLVLDLENVSFSYGRTPVIEEATLQLRRGQPACIIGPNGGGKTTLLRLMLGLLSPDQGRIRVLGKSPDKARPRIGYMPQFLQFDPAFPITVKEVVLQGRLKPVPGGFYRRADKEAADRALREVNLEDYAGAQFARLSGGQRQRVLIARALACEPELLLLDEPTANVDLVLEEKLLTALQQMHRRMTLVLVTHDIGFVSQLVQQVVCVNRRVHMHETSEITGRNIEEIYGAPVHAVHHHTH